MYGDFDADTTEEDTGKYMTAGAEEYRARGFNPLSDQVIVDNVYLPDVTEILTPRTPKKAVYKLLRNEHVHTSDFS